ncbi:MULTISPECIES: hypothetical protein [Sporomusa]|uniref:hypothetical protein n=1 Tax=Sporomusa TaxID=2375 RepID=UPI0016666D87|nr:MULTISPECIES: hypothetical protein [Sporomusa]HML35111.1 hypothetical protein [Sporomusa sphaeroides]
METDPKLIFKVDYINNKEKKCTKEQNSLNNKLYILSEFIDITKEQTFWDKAVPS